MNSVVNARSLFITGGNSVTVNCAADVQEYLTTQEVATKLRASPETVRFWRHINKGPKSFKVGRRVLYAREAWSSSSLRREPRSRAERCGRHASA
jgi:hypothetical protein